MNQKALAERLDDIKNKIKQAAVKSNRDYQDIQLIAVSKNHSYKKINFFKDQGQIIFGESRVQELRKKNEKVNNVDWHFIGHLQRNKVKYLMRMESCKLIHSVDSWRLVKEIDKRARKNKRVMPLLIEVNVSGDENKFGLKSEDVFDYVEKAEQLSNIKIKGLMTIVPYSDDPEDSRPYFKQMRILKDELIKRGFHINELSMGMSNDYQIAVEEGATMVRVGTALFGERRG